MSDDEPQDDSIAETIFQGLTPIGASCLLEMLVMGFGLCNAHATFSRLVNHVLAPYMNDFFVIYLDDICIHSDSVKQNIDHLRLVLHILREHELFMKMPECFEVARRRNILVSLWVMTLGERQLINSQPFVIGLYQKLKSKLNLVYNYVLTMVNVFIIFQIVLRH